jgi:hypothetical protein
MNSIIRSFARSIGADTKLSLCPLTLLQLLEEAALALNVSSQSVNETICKEWVRDARSLFDQLPDSAEEMSALLSSAPETQRVADPPSVPHFDFPAEEILPLRALLQPPHTDRLARGVLETFERYGYPPSKSPDSLDINLDGCHPQSARGAIRRSATRGANQGASTFTAHPRGSIRRISTRGGIPRSLNSFFTIVKFFSQFEGKTITNCKKKLIL